MSKNTADPVEVVGKVTDLYCQRPAFSAGKFTSNHKSYKFKLKGFVRPGQTLTFVGHWTNDPKWGKQFDASDVIYRMPVDVAGLRNWLQWEMEGVGPVTATKLVDEFGADLPKLCMEDAGQVAATCGVELCVVESIARAWQRFANVAMVKTKLAGIGLTQHQTEMIVEKFGNSSVSIIEANPYLLLGEVEGLGFAKVDEIAKKSGVSDRDQRRLAAAIQWSVKGGYQDDGHTAIPYEVAKAKAEQMLDMDEIDAGESIQNLIDSGKLKSYTNDAGDIWLSYATADRHERSIWKFLANAKSLAPLEFNERIEEGESICVGDIILDDIQSRSVYAAQEHRVSVVTGGAGAGKTLVAKAIHRHFKDNGFEVFLVAPTGKAARRMSEVIKEDAATIHRTLGYGPDGTFAYNEQNPLPHGLYIVDEVSMVDSMLMSCFLRALPAKATVVLIGDENQLPPVGPGAVLRDIIAHNLAHVTKLEKCHRQAGTLKKNCSGILNGTVALTDIENDPPAWVLHNKADTTEIVTAAIKKLYDSKLADWGFDPIREVQIMTAMHKGKHGTKYLNKLMQWMHQNKLGNELAEPDEEDDRRPILHVGDKVIHTKNNYVLNVMNGSVGYVVRTLPLTIEYEEGCIEYPDECKGQVELGYVLTPHKCQGSEFPCAVVIMPKAHTFMQSKNWFYTAATRAKKTTILIGTEDAIRRAAITNGGNTRTTLLNIWSDNPETISKGVL